MPAYDRSQFLGQKLKGLNAILRRSLTGKSVLYKSRMMALRYSNIKQRFFLCARSKSFLKSRWLARLEWKLCRLRGFTPAR
jgi:hypothetical protein